MVMPTDDLYKINKELCYSLWHLVDVNGQPDPQSPKLVFPKKRDDEIRVSEQESRILFCNLLEDTEYYYSIETPTVKSYQISGKVPLSALSDLSLYTIDEEFEKAVNVEFKAHNPPKEHIKKDVEKIVKEGIPGNWFHTLKNVNSRTLDSLFNKFKQSFREFEGERSSTLSVLFCFCVLDKRWACIKHFYYEGGDYEDYVDSFFNLDYTVGPGFVKVNKAYDWEFIGNTEPVGSKKAKISLEEFLDSCDEAGRSFFEEFLRLPSSSKLTVRWGTVGFSLGVYHNNTYLPICWGFPPNSKFGQSLVTKLGYIQQKVRDGEGIVDEFRHKLVDVGFIPYTKEMKFPVDRKMEGEKIKEIMNVFLEMADNIKEKNT